MKSLEQKIVCKTYTLSNGLTVWLNEDHNQPKVFGAVVVKPVEPHMPVTHIRCLYLSPEETVLMTVIDEM